jgi:IS1 family transposase
VTEEKRAASWGDSWTWTAIDADTKLIVSWLVAARDSLSASFFLRDVQSRIANRIQLTTDGNRLYADAVEYAFGEEVDYAQLIKIYGAPPREGPVRYSPARIIGTQLEVITGDPNPKHISTSYVERQNLSMRMGMRRFTRLTNGFSKKLENHVAANALYFLHYNFARIHRTLRVTPAMAAGIANHVWSIEEIVGLLDTSSAVAA